jgi:hypothetical protein
MIEVHMYLWVQMFTKRGQLEFQCRDVGENIIHMLGNEDDHVLGLVQYPYTWMDRWGCHNL